MSAPVGNFPFSVNRLEANVLPDDNIFELLSDVSYYSTQNKGRKGGVVVRCRADGGIPIVRTTTTYPRGPRSFSPTHLALAEAIQQTL